jgi:phage-related baseplate assembly protein
MNFCNGGVFEIAWLYMFETDPNFRNRIQKAFDEFSQKAV